MIGESILQLREGNAVDESIKSYEYDEYQPFTGTQLSSAGQITITIENQGLSLHLHNIYLLIEGDVLKAGNTRYADADLIVLANNRLMYLFSNMKLTLAGQMVEHVNYPGQATSLLGLAGFQTSMLRQSLLIPDLQYINAFWYRAPIQKVVSNATYIRFHG